MSEDEKRVVILTIGEIGAGKSAFGNLYLNKTSFELSTNSEPCTLVTSVAENNVNGIIRTVIDSQGLDTNGLDEAQVIQMVEFLKKWDKGVNAIAIVINGQTPRLSRGIQRLLKSIHIFFNNNDIWNSVCIVFTHWYDSMMTEADKEERKKYVKEVRKLANDCTGYDVDPQIPCFFVDAMSNLQKIDDNTKDEITSFNCYAYAMEPISKNNFKVHDPKYVATIVEIRNNILLSEDINEKELTRTRIYAIQKRSKQISYNNDITYTDWVNIKTRTDVAKKIIKEEFQLRRKIQQVKKDVKRTKKVETPTYFSFVPRYRIPVHDHTDVETIYEDRKREVVIDYDGKTTYGDWVQIRKYTEKTRE